MFRSGFQRIFGPAPIPLWLRTILFGAGYFLCAEAGVYLSVRNSTYVGFWLPAGLYVAVLLLNVRREWPWLVVGGFAANFIFDFSHGTRPITIIFIFSFANTIQSVLGAWLVQRFVNQRPSLTTLKEFVGLIGCAAILSTMVGATIGATALVSYGFNQSFVQSWKVWWGSCAMAILVLSPFILVGFSKFDPATARPFSPKKIPEGTILFCTLIFATWYILIKQGGIMSPYRAWLIPILLWAGLRFGTRGASAATLILALLTTFLTTQFLKGISPEQIASGEYVLIMQTVLATASLVAIVPAIVLGERDQTLAKLRESEGHFRNLNEAAFEGIAISENGRILDANNQMLEMFGHNREEMIGAQIVDLVAPESREIVAKAVREGLESIYEHQLLRKDGTSFHAEARAKVVRTGNRIIRMTALRDITERKQAERLTDAQRQVLEMIATGKPMRETLEALLRLVESQSSDMLCSILLLDPDGIHVRHGAAPSLPPDFLKAIDGRAIGPRAGSCGTAAFRREDVFVADIANDPLWTDYKQFALPHGLRACWSTPIFDAQSNVLGTFAIYHRRVGLPEERHLRLIGIATHTAAVCIAKHRTDEALRNSEALFRSYFELAVVGCTITSLEKGILAINDQFCQMLGYSREELLQMTWAQFTHPADFKADEMQFNRTLAGEIDSYTTDKRYVKKDGSIIYATIGVRCIRRPDGSPNYFVGLAQDITARREAILREQHAREEFTRQLIASQETERGRIAGELHDSLGQNLLLIKNRMRLAINSLDEPQQLQTQLDAIGQLATQAIAEVRQISHDLRPYQLDKLGLTRAIKALIESAAQSSPIKFEHRLEDVDNIFGKEAATNLYRIAQEVLNNVLRHSQATHVRVKLERDIHFVHFAFTDNGCGFKPRDKSAPSSGGFGLKNIGERVRILGGTLNLVSATEEGTRVEVTIPVHEEGGPEASSPPAA